MRDEVNEPLGIWPAQQPPSSGAGWTLPVLVAPVIVAVAMAAFTFGGYDARQRAEALAQKVEARPAPIVAYASPPAQPKPVADPIVPRDASSDKVNAASGVRITPNDAAGPPTPLIIDVQKALAAQQAHSAWIAPR